MQAFGLKPKLFQVERWVRKTPVRVVEIHPEVCFARLAGGPLTARKSSWAGAERRRGEGTTSGPRKDGRYVGAFYAPATAGSHKRVYVYGRTWEQARERQAG